MTLSMFRHRDPSPGPFNRRSPTCGAHASPDDDDLDQDKHCDCDMHSTTTTSTTSTSSTSSPDATMVGVDVFFLTLNCAKCLVDVPVLATHLLPALSQRSAGPAKLPDVVAL